MTRHERRLLFALAALALALLLAAFAVGAAVWATLDAAERDAVGAVLQSRFAVALMALVVVFALAALTLRTLIERYVTAPAQLLEQVQVRLTGDVQRDLEPGGSAANRALATAIGSLLQERAQLRDEMALKVARASREVEQERSRLAALMSELTQSVVVCNREGRILLYNGRARLQFRTLSSAPTVAGGSELIGLGRSIYAVFDQRLVAHALENIEVRLRRGAVGPTTHFVTATRAGQLLRVQVAAVLDPVEGQDTAPADGQATAPVDGQEATASADDRRAATSGFVLMLDNITRSFEQDSLRDRMLHDLTEGTRASLANVQAAVEMLELPDLEPAMRERFQAVVRDEVGTLSERVQRLATDPARRPGTSWPLDDMLGTDLVAAARQRIQAASGLGIDPDEVDPDLWLHVESFSILQALTWLAGRVEAELAVKAVRLRLRLDGAGRRARLDLAWVGQAPATATVSAWESMPMRTADDSTPLTVRDVVERHHGEFWFEREPSGEGGFLRFLLPLAEDRDASQPSSPDPGSRPEYYDFDLFKTSAQSRNLADRELGELSYTVFDTETTGLDPSAGDEIIQIGATRIVNGKLLQGESFIQLVDPQRSVSAASALIHGLRRDMLTGQPTIAQVLPAFHAFASDTVLVAHNAAFDMRFLELKQQSTGVRFEQPVLDTLLLSALVHPNQDSHSLEAIALRLDVPVRERHSALGDAMITAEVFLRLIPMLQGIGIRTLGQARAAAQQTYHARLRY